MFVTAEDFEIPPYSIPNLADPQDETASDGTFEDFVEEQEELELRMLLGDTLYEEFVTNIESTDEWWAKLRDGGSYTYNEKSYKWKGMKDMLVPYIWFMWMRWLETKKTQEGASLAVTENGERVSLARELCFAYNEYAHKSGFSECRSVRNTLYGLLKSDPEHYATWEDCSEVEYINPWNI